MSSNLSTRTIKKNSPLGTWAIRFIVAALSILTGMIGMNIFNSYFQNNSHISNVSDSDYFQLPVLSVSINDDSAQRTLRLQIVLELAPNSLAEIEKLSPIIIDNFTKKLRNLSMKDIAHTSSIETISAALNKDLSEVVNDGKIRRILITQFIIAGE